MMVSRLSLLLLAGSLSAVAGCRYRTGGALPEDVRTIGVVMLRNGTRVAGLECEVTQQIISAFNTGGRLQVVDSGGEPDLLVGGKVESYVRESVRSDRYGDVVSLRVVITARITVRRADGAYLLKDVIVVNTDVHPESGAVDMGRGQRESHGRAEAARDLGQSVARRIINQGW
jgi:hypothetical protein